MWALRVAAFLIALSAPAQNANQERMVKNFLAGFDPDMPAGTAILHAFVDLTGDGANEAIVYLSARRWCGSGGCTTLILAPEGNAYHLVTKVTIAQLPIRVLSTKSHGWRDIGVWVQGGGIQPGYEAKLRFNGSKYPSNPSVPPAVRLKSHVPGRTVIAREANPRQ